MKKIKHNIDIFVLAIAIVLVWRGVWGLADMYLFPSNGVLSFVISIIIGVTLLYLHDPKKKDIDELL